MEKKQRKPTRRQLALIKEQAAFNSALDTLAALLIDWRNTYFAKSNGFSPKMTAFFKIAERFGSFTSHANPVSERLNQYRDELWLHVDERLEKGQWLLYLQTLEKVDEYIPSSAASLEDNIKDALVGLCREKLSKQEITLQPSVKRYLAGDDSAEPIRKRKTPEKVLEKAVSELKEAEDALFASTDDEKPDGYSTWRQQKLRAELKRRGLKMRGSICELRGRLILNDQTQQALPPRKKSKWNRRDFQDTVAEDTTEEAAEEEENESEGY